MNQLDLSKDMMRKLINRHGVDAVLKALMYACTEICLDGVGGFGRLAARLNNAREEFQNRPSSIEQDDDLLGTDPSLYDPDLF